MMPASEPWITLRSDHLDFDVLKVKRDLGPLDTAADQPKPQPI
jgi:hypothetical protein